MFNLINDERRADKVVFYQRSDFSENRSGPFINAGEKIYNLVVEYIERGDKLTQLYYTKQHMDTKLCNKTNSSPAYLILDPIPEGYFPDY